jgi:carbon starvation protein
MSNSIKKIVWFCISLLGAFAFSLIALEREESINALWFITAAVCIYMVSYRFYSAWIASKVFVLDEFRQTPAVRLNNGRDFLPTNKWVVFATHFAAIAGPGPLIGPTLAAQFGYLPGTIWILVGAVVGGAVQDMTVLFFSVRRNGKSLGQMAKEELGVLAGIASLIGTFMIMIILIAVLGLIVVNAMKHSPWATSTVAATIPIAMIVGFYMRFIRPGRILEATLLGVFLLLMAVYAGSIIDQSETMRVYFDHSGLFLAWAIIIYGFSAAVLPIWMLLAPRDYLSTFVKLGTVIFLAIAIAILQPEIKMPAITQFVDGSGPIFGGG